MDLFSVTIVVPLKVLGSTSTCGAIPLGAPFCIAIGGIPLGVPEGGFPFGCIWLDVPVGD